MDRFKTARAETVRYHEELYASSSLGSPGSWLANPHPSVIDAIGRVEDEAAVQAFDLGSGVGRHAIPMARLLPAGSIVTAVDLLPSAIRRLRDNCSRAGVAASVVPVVADIEEFEFGVARASLIVGFSSIEHVSSPEAMRALLERCRDATRSRGVVMFGVLADRVEVAADGTTTDGFVETRLSSDEAGRCLEGVFDDWQVIRHEVHPSAATEQRDGVEHELRGSLVLFTARRP